MMKKRRFWRRILVISIQLGVVLIAAWATTGTAEPCSTDSMKNSAPKLTDAISRIASVIAKGETNWYPLGR